MKCLFRNVLCHNEKFWVPKLFFVITPNYSLPPLLIIYGNRILSTILKLKAAQFWPRSYFFPRKLFKYFQTFFIAAHLMRINSSMATLLNTQTAAQTIIIDFG